MSQVQKRPPDLPDFNKPPVTETILSLQFEPIAKMTAVHVGVLWQRFREQFPLVEEHPTTAAHFGKVRPGDSFWTRHQNRRRSPNSQGMVHE